MTVSTIAVHNVASLLILVQAKFLSILDHDLSDDHLFFSQMSLNLAFSQSRSWICPSALAAVDDTTLFIANEPKQHQFGSNVVLLLANASIEAVQDHTLHANSVFIAENSSIFMLKWEGNLSQTPAFINDQLIIDDNEYQLASNSFEGAPVRVAISRGLFQGFSKAFLAAIAEELAFEASFSWPDDGQFGMKLRNELNETFWTGFIGQLIKGEVDLAAADITHTIERDDVIDFSKHQVIN